MQAEKGQKRARKGGEKGRETDGKGTGKGREKGRKRGGKGASTGPHNFRRAACHHMVLFGGLKHGVELCCMGLWTVGLCGRRGSMGHSRNCSWLQVMAIAAAASARCRSQGSERGLGKGARKGGKLRMGWG